MGKFDIAKFTRRASRKKKELSKFLVKLGKTKKRGIVKLALEVDKEVWKEVSCLDCANCCKKMTPTYNKKDILRISAHFNQTYQEFYDKWLKVDENKDIINKSTPCQFLGKGNKCSIYDIRPVDCSEFPHFVRKDVKYQAAEKIYTQNMSYCPATLRFVEKLQEAIGADL